MNKVADKLAALVASEDPDSEVNLHVMLQRDLEASQAEAIVQNLQELATDKKNFKLFSLSGIVSLRGTLKVVKAIAKDPNVVWVDQDSEAPMAELLDQ